jgi:hypothetical protein
MSEGLTQNPTPIKRYDISAYCEGCGSALSVGYGVDIEEDPYGEWIRYEDHVAELRKLEPSNRKYGAGQSRYQP